MSGTARRRADVSAAGGPGITSVEADAFTVPTEALESDGTLEWDATTLVVVRVRAGDEEGLGYTYASGAAVDVARDLLAPVLIGRSSMAPGAAWEAMRRSLRNVGRPGVGGCALSALDTALWDLKARLLDLPLVDLLGGGAIQESVAVYGSGGFTSMGPEEVAEQLGGWADDGMGMVKMKVGRDPEADPARLRAAREAVGDRVELFVDANGAFHRKEALGHAGLYESFGVSWFEEPVSSDDLAGLRLLRDDGPAGMRIVAGEYGWDLYDFRDLIAAEAIDTLQADVTRCGGFTAFLRVAALCEAHHLPLSAHTAPALHLPVMCAVPNAVHVEWFHDHARIESLLLDGAPRPVAGALTPDRTRPGHGLRLRESDAVAYRT